MQQNFEIDGDISGEILPQLSIKMCNGEVVEGEAPEIIGEPAKPGKQVKPEAKQRQKSPPPPLENPPRKVVEKKHKKQKKQKKGWKELKPEGPPVSPAQRAAQIIHQTLVENYWAVNLAHVLTQLIQEGYTYVTIHNLVDHARRAGLVHISPAVIKNVGGEHIFRCRINSWQIYTFMENKVRSDGPSLFTVGQIANLFGSLPRVVRAILMDMTREGALQHYEKEDNFSLRLDVDTDPETLPKIIRDDYWKLRQLMNGI